MVKKVKSPKAASVRTAGKASRPTRPNVSVDKTRPAKNREKLPDSVDINEDGIELL